MTTRRWGSSWRQRLRLLPLSLAVRCADVAASFVPSAPLRGADWRPGICVLIPERDAPGMLEEALDAVDASRVGFDEPVQVIVVANGSPAANYTGLRERHPDVEFVFSEAPLGFVTAVECGLAHVASDWALLLNNDMVLAPGAIGALAARRGRDVFAIGAAIDQRGADGRQEETGFIDWYVAGDGVHLYHAPHDERRDAPSLCASGGAALFRSAVLRRYVRDSRIYAPFYWEDADWGLRAWRDGWRIVFTPDARARHRHRASTARFYPEDELRRIVERNRLLFDARHALTPEPHAALMQRICDLPYASQRELAAPAVAMSVLAQRTRARRSRHPAAPPALWTRDGRSLALAPQSFSYALTAQPEHPARLLVVTPFVTFPARHGSARRTAELIAGARRGWDVIFVTDEARQHDARSFRGFDGLRGVYLADRAASGELPSPADIERRMAGHVHPELERAVAAALREHRPAVVQIEHVELAPLVRLRSKGESWILGLHDAYRAEDFASPVRATIFERDVLASYAAVTVCSDEDAALVRHPRVVCIPNGSAVQLGGYAPSSSQVMLFIGPFRYPPNRRAMEAFIREALPCIRAAVPGAVLRILAGDEGVRMCAKDGLFRQPGIEVLGHRDDVRAQLDACALTVNPLTGIRGSAVKLIESLSAGRICVSTEEGARGFTGEDLRGLVRVPDVAAMAPPIVALLRDAPERHRIEAPDAGKLGPFQWEACAARHQALLHALLAERHES